MLRIHRLWPVSLPPPRPFCRFIHKIISRNCLEQRRWSLSPLAHSDSQPRRFSSHNIDDEKSSLRSTIYDKNITGILSTRFRFSISRGNKKKLNSPKKHAHTRQFYEVNRRLSSDSRWREILVSDRRMINEKKIIVKKIGSEFERWSGRSFDSSGETFDGGSSTETRWEFAIFFFFPFFFLSKTEPLPWRTLCISLTHSLTRTHTHTH